MLTMFPAISSHAVPLAVMRPPPTLQGSLVRAIRREEELLRQLHEALKGIGEMTLADKFDEARTRIKRDIIFAASLYL